MVPASIKRLSISSEVKLVFEGLVNGVLFNYTFVAFTILLFIAGCIMVIVGKKKNKKSMKIIAYIIISVCILYFAFLLWCVIGFGSNVPANDPIPISPTK